MENTARLDAIKGKLRKLKNNDLKFNVPGSGKHRYESFRVDEREIHAFEEQIGVKLPDEFRHFIQYIGTGAGPSYGILALNEIRIILKKWEVDIGKKADFSGIFQFPEETAQRTFEARKSLTHYEKLKLQKLDGILPICHLGGTNYIYIVICGEGEGRIWSLNLDGYETMPLGSIYCYYFLDWYENWLDTNIGNYGDDAMSSFYIDYLRAIFPEKNDIDVYRENKLFFDKDNLDSFAEIDEDNANIDWLSMSDCSLNNLPDKIFKIKGFKGLDLSSNNLSGIYSSIRNMRELKYISLSHNNFKALPDSLRLLKELNILDASYNSIESVPDFIGNLENLLYINLSNNRIRDIHPSISRLKKLKKIDLSNNKGLFGLNALIALSNLEVLNLSGCGLLIFPFYITMLQNIKRLYLTGNSFNRLPPEIQNLRTLEVLTLNESLAENLDETIDLISGFKNLKELYLPYVDLFKLPKNIIKLKYVKKITMYPALQNRGKIPDKELAGEFVKRLMKVFEGSTVNLVY